MLGDIAGRRALYSPDKLAVVDAATQPHRAFTYRRLDERANRLANWLRSEAGVRRGDRVGILAHDGVEVLDAFFACAKLGAALACFNWRLHWQELVALAGMTRPRVLIYSEAFSQAVDNLAPAAGLDRLLHIGGQPPENALSYDAALARSADAPVITDNLSEEEIVLLLFTGGTTGAPKAAQISHRMIGWNTLNTIIHDLTHGDVYVNVFPMFHTGGLLVYTLPLLILGGTVITTPRFQPEQVLDLLQQYGATVFAGVPTMYQLLTQARNWPDADLSRLRFCTSGGAPLPVPLVEQFRDEKGVRFKQGFGMTEFGPGLFALAPDDAIRKAGSIGRPNFYVEARIVDDANQTLPPDAVGELVLRGPSMASGYFENPEATAAAIDADGWFHTGDLARCDAEGYFFIVDRKKDMFISGGENVYPAEIEQALYRHPAVLQCAVIAVPDVTWGEVGKACVVLKPDQAATARELLNFLAGQLARYKVPRSVEFLAELPVSGAGKILKRELRERFTSGATAKENDV